MSKNVLHAKGTTFERGSGDPLVYDEIAQVANVNPVGWKRKALDVTTLDQTADSPEKVGSILVEYDAVDLELVYDPASTAMSTLEQDKLSTDPVPYRITLRNGDKYAFLGVITGWKYDGKVTDVYKVKATIEVSGAVTFTAGSH